MSGDTIPTIPVWIVASAAGGMVAKPGWQYLHNIGISMTSRQNHGGQEAALSTSRKQFLPPHNLRL